MVKHAYGVASAPTDVVDRLLWREAQRMLERHAEPTLEGLCAWCGQDWPCGPRRLAEQAEMVAFEPWAQRATVTPVSPAQRRGHHAEDARSGSALNRGPARD